MKYYEISCEGHNIYCGLNDISCYEPIALKNQLNVIASDYNHLLLHVGPPFGNRLLNKSWAVGLT